MSETNSNEYDNESYFTSEKVNDSEINSSVMQVIIEPNIYLDTLKKYLDGKVKKQTKWEKESDEAATDQAINYFIAQIGSFLNTHEILNSSIDETQLNNKYEGNCNSMEDYLLNQPTVSADDLSVMMDIFRNCCETVKNLVLSGHGAEIISKILNGGYVERANPSGSDDKGFNIPFFGGKKNG
jgi:hypothetical protein